MICVLFMGSIYMSVNISLIVLKKMYDILIILVDFCGIHDFGGFYATRIRIRFIEADPNPADQNERIQTNHRIIIRSRFRITYDLC